MSHTPSPTVPRISALLLVVTLGVSCALGCAGLAQALPAAAPKPAAKPARQLSDVREAEPPVTSARRIKLTAADRGAFTRQAAAIAPTKQRGAVDGPPVATGTAIGGTKTWLVLNEQQDYAPVTYVLRGVGVHTEVWVQQDLDFPAGDCRNDGVRNVVTDHQVQDLVSAFDTTIYPRESRAFSVAPDRDGSHEADVGYGAPLWQLLGNGRPDYYQGDGAKTVTLVSNSRDANYYDPTSPAGQTYVAGFFSPFYNEAFDRNIMTIDSYDWLHRSGAHPPDDAARASLCSSAQPARPRLYEATFAHEYQHLLQYYRDHAEHTWLDEGLSDYAQTLVGYVNARTAYGRPGADSQLTCFQGFAGSSSFPYCGADNSLTRWEDRGASSVLADYGAAYSFLLYLADQFGPRVVGYLHRDGQAQGLASLQNYLDDHAPGLTSSDVIHDWVAQMALDRLVDHGARGLTRDQRARFTAARQSGAVDWSWPGSYDSPGAPANGADYVLAMHGRPVNGRTITSVSFSGAQHYAPDPVQWRINGGALYSGTGGNLDRAAIFRVAVPAGAASLSFSTRYNTEQGYDFGVVQVSTDGGHHYTSLGNDETTPSAGDGAHSGIVDQLPGLTGLRPDFHRVTYDLSAYAGRRVLLSFRYLSDSVVNGTDQEAASGWWVKDVRVGSTLVSSGTTLKGALSPTGAAPVGVAGWQLQAVGWKLDGTRVRYAEIRLNRHHHRSLSKATVRRLFKGADRIGFLVTADDPGEVATKNAGYRLRVNGQTQAGGPATPTRQVRPPQAVRAH